MYAKDYNLVLKESESHCSPLEFDIAGFFFPAISAP